MMWTRFLLHTAPAVALLIVMTFSAPVRSAEGGNQGETQKASQSQKDQPAAPSANQGAGDAQPAAEAGEAEKKKDTQQSRQLKVFELKHRSPQELMQVFNTVHGSAVGGQPGFAGVPGQQTLGFRGTGKDDLAIAVHDQKKLIFVRGSQQQIEKVERLIQAVDMEGGQLKKQEFNGVHLMPVKRDDSSHIQSTLSQLGLGGRMLYVGDQTFVVFQAKDDNAEELNQVEEVISRLSAQEEESAEPSTEEEASGDDQGSTGQDKDTSQGSQGSNNQDDSSNG